MSVQFAFESDAAESPVLMRSLHALSEGRAADELTLCDRCSKARDALVGGAMGTA